MELVVLDHGVRPDGCRAPGLEPGEQRALGEDREAGREVVEARDDLGEVEGLARAAVGQEVERREGRQVRGPDLDAQGPLPGSGGHDAHVDDLGDRVEPAQAREPRVGEDDRVEVRVGAESAREARVDVAADVEHVEVGADREELGRAARGPGADLGAARQGRERPAVPGAQDVARVLALGGHEGQPLGRAGRQVLERVDRDVAAAVEQGLAQRGHEHPGAAHRGERARADVALGADAHDLDRMPGQVHDASCDESRLGRREGAATGSDTNAHAPSLLCPEALSKCA
ncbi:hypothetical protein OJAG_04270 [Oerskovia enterophila]|uniref:Uncharacterized protein n=1 Tax=Oerskovia enterophila TaxID=43678 RepID=A0A161XJ85_9CELL|nr:hypothetical protein OJAG_04270 [Oerskovia enterophila]